MFKKLLLLALLTSVLCSCGSNFTPYRTNDFAQTRCLASTTPSKDC